MQRAITLMPASEPQPHAVTGSSAPVLVQGSLPLSSLAVICNTTHIEFVLSCRTAAGLHMILLHALQPPQLGPLQTGANHRSICVLYCVDICDGERLAKHTSAFSDYTPPWPPEEAVLTKFQ